MRKITGLKEKRTYYQREKDAYGNILREPYEVDIPYELPLVSGFPRFAHWFLDGIIIGAIQLLLGYLQIDFYKTSIDLTFYRYDLSFINLMISFLYYFLSENSIQRTIGKYATNSIVVDEYGNKPTSQQFLIRTLCRFIPFEAFSCLFSQRGWHDTISKTFLIKASELNTIKRLQQEENGFYMTDNEDILD